MEYRFTDIERRWQDWWRKNHIYKTPDPGPALTEGKDVAPKCYVLDMFPYPSGAGLHVGHPLGYIASDIYSRYKRLKGFNVLHPMGYDAFGLPAEQYAIDHGIHPAISTATNISNFRAQLEKIGFSFDWDRQVNTSEPGYYKWTQWIFLQLYKSFFNRHNGKAEPISILIASFEKEGNKKFEIPNDKFQLPGRQERSANLPLQFDASAWQAYSESDKQAILMEYRLSYCGFGEVNWCEALGTVLANDEVINGVSERGGYPVIKKKLRQWYMRITEYADRLLEGLQKVDYSEAMKEMQSNWIGKSVGAEIVFALQGQPAATMLKVYTTRPDTIFGVDFMVIAPEHELVGKITTAGQKAAVEDYITYANSRSERERMAEKKISGVFTGAYALNPFNQRPIPVWAAEYVLAGYGTGAIMGVPCGDERDHRFAKHFNIPITNIIGSYYNGSEANPTYEAVLENSGFLNGIVMKDAIEIVIKKLEEDGIGKKKVNFKMRDAAFSRQRYWGEPIPIVWKDGVAYPLDEKDLPLELPHVDSYKPGPDGEGPLSNIKEWVEDKHLPPALKGGLRETNTMPGYAGSSWYFLRYMDPHNEKEFCERRLSDYWNQVDLYIGGTEHAVGHLLYSRLWTKCLYDLGYIAFDEPYKRLVNQGMIQASSRFIYRLSMQYQPKESDGLEIQKMPMAFISKGQIDRVNAEGLSKDELDLFRSSFRQLNGYDGEPSFKEIVPLHVDVNIVDGFDLDLEAFRNWRKGEYRDAVIILENGSINRPGDEGKNARYICGSEVEKMSKSKFNTVNPDDLVAKYGADTFRMYEMFLGPVEMSKPWDTKGIEGVHRFLKKLWRLFFDETTGRKLWTEEKATPAELKVLHATIKKIEADTERFSFNTGVSGFMIAVNELTDLKSHKKEILEPLLILLTPYAPHIAEELFAQLHGHLVDQTHGEIKMQKNDSILNAVYPKLDEKYLEETSKEYPISINGKLRTTMNIALDAPQPEVEKLVLENDVVKKWLEGKPPKKIIYVKNKMINLVV